MKIIFRSILLVCALLTASVFPGGVFASEKIPASSGNGTTQDSTKPTQFDPGLYVTVKSAIRDIKKDPGKTILVDVRRKDDFEKAKIPGAINMALYSIKTKSYLKKKPFLLIDEGFGSPSLQQTCAGLRANGFNAQILFGGIKLWHEAGGPVTGDFFYLDDLDRISPQAFHLSKNLGHWRVLDISAASESNRCKELIVDSQAVFLNDVNEFERKLKAAVSSASRNRFSATLIVSNDGSSYEKIRNAVRNAKINNVFYLDGGSGAYCQFLKNLSLMQGHEKGTTIGQKKCNVCP